MADTVFWTNVNNLIKAQKLTQEEVCKTSGISIYTLRGWISKNVLPRADEAVLIAQSLNTTVEFLVTGVVVNKAEKELKELKEALIKLAQ